MCYSARLVVWFAKKGGKKVYIRLVLFLMLLLCVFILYLQGHYSFLVPQQRWFTTCRSGCLCRRMNKSLWEKFTCIGYRTIWIYLFTLHLLLSASWSSHHLLHRMQMHCRKVWSEQRRTWFAYTFATRRPTVHGNNTRGQRKNRRRVDRVFGRDRQMSISRCFLPSHYDTGRTWTEIKLNQVGCIKCLSLAWLVELVEFEFST